MKQKVQFTVAGAIIDVELSKQNEKVKHSQPGYLTSNKLQYTETPRT